MTSMFGDWEPFLSQEMAQPYFLELQNSVNDDRQHHTVYPAEQDVLTAFTSTSYERTSVLILGQDPYHGDGQAHGLSFSVPENIALPPSLRNIMKERNSDVDIPFPRHGNLTKWATQGVLLLNSTLTVRAGEAGSHQDFGWETFSNAVITHLNQKYHSSGIRALGKVCESETTIDYGTSPRCPHCTSSITTISASRVLWKPAILKN